MILMVIVFRKERKRREFTHRIFLDESEYILQMMLTSLHRSRPALMPGGTSSIVDTGS